MKAFWNTYGIHLVGYLFSILTAVSHLPAPLAGLLGPDGALIIGIAGILVTAIHNVQTVVKKNSATSVNITAKSLACLVALPLILLAGSGLSGCSTLTSVLDNPQVISSITAGLTAILEAAGGNESTLNSQASTALTAAQGTEVTLSALATALSSIPGLSSAVNQYLTENPTLATVEATTNAWLSAIVSATTPGTTTESAAKAQLAVRRAGPH